MKKAFKDTQLRVNNLKSTMTHITTHRTGIKVKTQDASHQRLTAHGPFGAMDSKRQIVGCGQMRMVRPHVRTMDTSKEWSVDSSDHTTAVKALMLLVPPPLSRAADSRQLISLHISSNTRNPLRFASILSYWTQKMDCIVNKIVLQG